MLIDTGMKNTGLISRNYDAINKANKIIEGKTAEDLKSNTSGTMQELSTEEDEAGFSMQIANAKAVLNSIGSSVNTSV